MPTRRNPDSRTTLSVDQHVKDVVIPRMDMAVFKGMQNLDRFQLAMAIGIHNGMKLPLSRRNDGGYVRREYFTPRFTTLFNAIRLAETDYQDPDCLQNESESLDLVEKYANGGFQYIEGDLDESASSEEIANSFIADMDSLYKEYTGKDPLQ